MKPELHHARPLPGSEQPVPPPGGRELAASPNATNQHLEPQQLREFRAQLLDPVLCGRILSALGEPAPEPDPVIIRTDEESVDLAVARALALATIGILAKVELIHAHPNN